MYYSLLKYLLKDNPDEVLSKAGIKVRKAINPLFRQVMMLFTKRNLEIKGQAQVPKDKKIIYAGTHGFHDDIIYSMKTANDHAYLLYGSLMDFFGSFHGVGLWANGVVLVDRKNKKSRQSSIEKMVKAQELGANIIMFPEGTWNKTESLLVQKLYPGIYDVAKRTGALVVPIATIEYEDKSYSIQGEAYDITAIDDKTALEILKNQINKLIKCKDLLIYPNMKDIQNNIENILTKINEQFPLSDLSLEQKTTLIDDISNQSQELYNFILNTITNQEIDKESIEYSILKRCNIILKAIVNQKKIVALEGLRDKMCTLKYGLYRHGDKSEFSEDYWENYVEKLIATTKGLYDHAIEDVAEYKDPEEANAEDVFAPIDNLEVTKDNFHTLNLKRR